ncbi:cell division protein ZapA [Pseudonocardia sp. TMWB2A]|uniref:cell division protein ZapA n=1 Tax=Pseudonocardia sp. TMWB2A TaxID=687430 RepID=UPI00307FC497
MGDVRLTVAGRPYDVACADGDEPHLQKLAALVDEKAQQARLVVGDVNETRILLFAAIFMADELQNARANVEKSEERPDLTPGLLEMAARINQLADSIATKN